MALEHGVSSCASGGVRYMLVGTRDENCRRRQRTAAREPRGAYGAGQGRWWCLASKDLTTSECWTPAASFVYSPGATGAVALAQAGVAMSRD